MYGMSISWNVKLEIMCHRKEKSIPESKQGNKSSFSVFYFHKKTTGIKRWNSNSGWKCLTTKESSSLPTFLKIEQVSTSYVIWYSTVGGHSIAGQ